MAKTPTTRTDATDPRPAAVQPAAPVNRFLAHFPLDRTQIRTMKRTEKTWTNGTIPTTLAQITFEVGETGMLIPNIRLQHLRDVSGFEQLAVMMPSTPRNKGALHIPVFSIDRGSDTDQAWQEYCALVIDRYKAIRRNERANGAPALSESNRRGVAVSKDDLADLGIDLDNTPAATPATAPTATE